MRRDFTGFIDTAAGPTFVRTVGKGSPVFVVHGGPGFDHRYLAPAIEPLLDRRLVFYDQPGCGLTPAPAGGASFEATVRHFRSLRQSMAGEDQIGVLAHSWGALVAIAAAASGEVFAEGVLINPVPVSTADYQRCQQDFLARLPQATSTRLVELLGAGAPGDSILDLILPYYHGPSPYSLASDVHIDIQTYLAVEASIGDFDFSRSLAGLSALVVCLGELDFTRRALIVELRAATRKTFELQGVCHFPFYEAPERFRPIMREAFPPSPSL